MTLVPPPPMCSEIAPSNTFLPELATSLRECVSWFVTDGSGPARCFHAPKPWEFWHAATDDRYSWLPHHPRAPWWVHDLIEGLAEEQLVQETDVFQGLFLCELLAALSPSGTTRERAAALADFMNLPSPPLRDHPKLWDWFSASPVRSEYYLEAVRWHLDFEADPKPGAHEALVAAQVIERRRLAEHLLGELDSRRGVLVRCIPSEFEGLAQHRQAGKKTLLEASRAFGRMNHEDIRRLLRAFEKNGLLGLSPQERHLTWEGSEDDVRAVQAQRTLARAALTISLCN